MERCIHAEALTTFDIAPDGSSVKLNVRDDQGAAAALELPTLCLNQLLMTLPRMIQGALRKSRKDDSLRLVHSMERFGLELGEPDANGEQRFILTLQTGNGFEVSFALTHVQLGAVVQSIVDDALIPSSEQRPAVLHS